MFANKSCLTQCSFTSHHRFAGDHENVIKELQSELDAKEDLINRKQAELSRANQKHYELEQELAFYKIDTKFTSLHRKPETPSIEVNRNHFINHPTLALSSYQDALKDCSHCLSGPGRVVCSCRAKTAIYAS